MQTFLPYPSFEESAKVLDNKRLGKQRVEAYQILKTLSQGPYTCQYCKSGSLDNDICGGIGREFKPTPWYNHPAVQMWKGYEDTLKKYFNCVLAEWLFRGFKNNMEYMIPESYHDDPKWLGDKKFHASHRSNLLRKDPKHYSKFGWKEPDNLPYYWPTKEGY